MNKRVSYLSILSRSSIYKLLAVVVSMGIFEYFSFQFTLNRALCFLTPGAVENNYPTLSEYFFERVIDQSFISKIFLMAVLLCTLILIWSESEKGRSKSNIFYNRLVLSGKERFILWTLYNSMTYVLLMAVQMLLILIFGKLYMGIIPEEYLPNNMLFLACYRSEFLHSLIPLAETIKWIKNISLILAISVEISIFAMLGDRKLTLILALLLFLGGFVQEMGHFVFDGVVILACWVVVLVDLYQFFKERDERVV